MTVATGGALPPIEPQDREIVPAQLALDDPELVRPPHHGDDRLPAIQDEDAAEQHAPREAKPGHQEAAADEDAAAHPGLRPQVEHQREAGECEAGSQDVARQVGRAIEAAPERAKAVQVGDVEDRDPDHEEKSERPDMERPECFIRYIGMADKQGKPKRAVEEYDIAEEEEYGFFAVADHGERQSLGLSP